MARFRFSSFVAGSICVLGAYSAFGQWNPSSGQWGKTDPLDIRVMQWNVQDGICSRNNKAEVASDWSALARIVAAMKPDILMIQEAGDNNAETGAGTVDTVSALNTTIDLFLHGGTDVFTAGLPPVGSWVRKYAPNFDLPFIFVSPASDGFNRNVIMSRFPFVDLNGDGFSQLSDIPTVVADQYAPGGTGGIRGFMTAELDLPAASYCGNLVVGTCHLKSGGAASDFTDRLNASKNITYVIDYWFNGAGTGMPDPNNKISDFPPATRILGADTPFIWSGDWNEDEQTNGRKGPAEWMTQANTLAGTDGTDRDRSDSTYDTSTNVFSSDRSTQGSGKLDYIAWQDSVVTLRRSFIFNSSPLNAAQMPPELNGFGSVFSGPNTASGTASDHRPVIADFIFRRVGVNACTETPDCGPTVGDLNSDGVVNLTDLSQLLSNFGQPGTLTQGDISGDGVVDLTDLSRLLGRFGITCN